MAAALVGFDDCVTDARIEAFSRFVDARREKAIRIAWRLTAGTGTGDHALAEDAAQDAFCELWSLDWVSEFARVAAIAAECG